MSQYLHTASCSGPDSTPGVAPPWIIALGGIFHSYACNMTLLNITFESWIVTSQAQGCGLSGEKIITVITLPMLLYSPGMIHFIPVTTDQLQPMQIPAAGGDSIFSLLREIHLSEKKLLELHLLNKK